MAMLVITRWYVQYFQWNPDSSIPQIAAELTASTTQKAEGPNPPMHPESRCRLREKQTSRLLSHLLMWLYTCVYDISSYVIIFHCAILYFIISPLMFSTYFWISTYPHPQVPWRINTWAAHASGPAEGSVPKPSGHRFSSFLGRGGSLKL